METAQQAAYAAGTAVSASLARMQAKAAQLSEELHLAQASTTISGTATSTEERSHSLCLEAYTEAGSSKQSAATLSTPSVFKRLSAASTSAIKPADPGPSDPAYQAVALQCQKLDAEVQLWKVRHAEVIKDLDRHQDSYMRREEQLKAQLAALRQPQESTTAAAGGSTGQDNNSSWHAAAAGASNSRNSGEATDCSPAADGTEYGSSRPATERGQIVQKPLMLQDMQQQVLEGLEELLQRQRLQMRTEESQQLREFRGRLVEIEAQLAAYRQAAAAHQDDWMGKTVALREELTVTQEIAGKLDAMYKLAEEEAAQLRVEFRAQEDDRQHIIRQLLELRRENTRLKQDQAALEDELDQIMAQALEAEAESPSASSQLNGTCLTAGLGASAAKGASCNNNLAAAVVEVAGSRAPRRGSSGGSGSDRPLTANSSERQHTTYQPTRHHQQQHVRPLSAAPDLQRTQGRQAAECAATASNNSLHDAAVETRMMRYSHVIQKLRKLLEVERRQLRHAQTAYNAELSKRTELQTLLLDSIELAKQNHRVAQAAYEAQHHVQAHAAATGHHAPGRSRPRSAVSGSDISARPAAAAFEARQQAGSSRPASAAVAGLRSGCNALWITSNAQQLDAATWDRLLDDLLIRRQLLELVFKHAFPNFTADADGLFCSTQQSNGTCAPVDKQLQHPERLLQQVAQWQSREQQHRQLQGQPVDEQQQQRLLWQHKDEMGPTCLSKSVSSSSQEAITPYVGSEASTSDDELCVAGSRSDQDVEVSSRFHSLKQKADYEQHEGEHYQHVAVQAEQAQLLQQGAGCSQQPPQQQVQRPANETALAGVMLPGFPIRQQLHHTRIQRPRPRQEQEQQLSTRLLSAHSNRPSSAAVPSAAGPWRHMMSGRPHSAVCSQYQNLDAASKGRSRNKVCPAVTVAAASLPPGSTCQSLQVSSPKWAVRADQLMESFLSNSQQHKV